METKHTKGEWIMDCRNKAIEENPNHLQIISNEVQICLVNHAIGEINVHEYVANAKLIAAAPDLLEACIKMVAACNKYNIEVLVPEYENMINAISKATE
jgi:hypothetical protein